MTKAQTDKRYSFDFIRVGWGLVKHDEKRGIALLAMVTFCVSIIDMTGIASLVPLISLSAEVDGVSENPWLSHLYRFLGEPERDQFLLILLATTSTLFIASAVMKLLVDRAAVRFTARCQSRLVDELTAMLMRAPYIWFLKQNSAALGRLIYADTGMWGGNFIMGIVMLVNSLISVVIMALTVMLLTPWSGLAVILIMLGSTLALMLPIRARLERYATLQRKNAQDVMIAVNQAVAGIKDIKLSSRETFFSKSASGHYSAMSDNAAKTKTLQMIPPTALLLIGQLVLILVGAILWKIGLSAAEIASQLAIIVVISSRLVPTINRLNGNYTSLWTAYPFVVGVRDLENELTAMTTTVVTSEQPPPIPQDWTLFTLDKVHFSYGSDSEKALHDISLLIKKNRAYGIVGPSGSGKSTLVDILLGLITPSHGEILIDGRPFREMSINSWQASIGYVPQAPFMADDTLRANIAFGVPHESIDEQRIKECLNMAYLDDLLDSLEDGLDTVLGDRGVRLSGGQRQRVAIARALYSKPSVIVLDEATSALDTISEKGVQAAIDRMHGKVTTITIAHRLSTISHCDTIFVLEKGRLVEQGDYEHLSQNGSLFKSMSSSH